MRKFDEKFSEDILERLGRLKPETKPQWGSMSTAQLFGHLTGTIEVTMGKGKQFAFHGNFKTRWLFRPLILSGLAALPRNVKLPPQTGEAKPPLAVEGTPEKLREAFDDYFRMHHEGSLPSIMHPILGPMNPAQWGRFHVAHFKHHLTQFGVWDL